MKPEQKAAEKRPRTAAWWHDKAIRDKHGYARAKKEFEIIYGVAQTERDEPPALPNCHKPFLFGCSYYGNKGECCAEHASGCGGKWAPCERDKHPKVTK